MRNHILNPLFSSLDNIKGIGEKSAKNLSKIGITKPLHLLWHFPTNILERKYYDSLLRAEPDSLGIITLRVIDHKFSSVRMRNVPHKITCVDSNEHKLTIIHFHGYKDYLEKLYPLDSTIYVSGKLVFYKDQWQITHPDYVSSSLDEIPEIEKRYPLTSGISNKLMYKWIVKSLELLPNLPEWQDEKFLRSVGWASFKDSINLIHNANSEADFLPMSKYVRRLAYDELLAEQLALMLYRKHYGVRAGSKVPPSKVLLPQLLKLLPFSLTASQLSAIDDINADLNTSNQMLRLLQGDVGSGKTLVAIVSALSVIENGGQVAIMAPTDLLARQHFLTTTKYLESLGINVRLLTSKEGAKRKKEIIEELKLGTVNIVIGTHSLFQDDVLFKNLQFVIIDEQHKFGVHQRLRLTQKGDNPHVLVMTATPIPRTLQMAMYGDIDTTTITEKPAGRKEIDTRIVSQENIDDLLGGISRLLKNNEKVFWVCPIIEESEKLDITAAEDRYKYLKENLKNHEILMVHGKMGVEQREEIMNQFKDNKKGSVLVATTVIEVGIDIPDSNIIIIEHAERFGLSQLHQLRGRVGRLDKEGVCILLYGKEISEVGKARLKIMRSTNDGFVIAEKDLELRGGGDTLGIRQSGAQSFKIANLSYHKDLLEFAHREARDILSKDEYLQSDRGKQLQNLLYLFEKNDAVLTRLGG